MVSRICCSEDEFSVNRVHRPVRKTPGQAFVGPEGIPARESPDGRRPTRVLPEPRSPKLPLP
jgi:hypothetical protein